jgi:hypothetical protein
MVTTLFGAGLARTPFLVMTRMIACMEKVALTGLMEAMVAILSTEEITMILS